ncbi:MAG: hypothetical protein Q8N63_00470 [Nanoarchaeota archaeon]|nr:hypothetical protein [Nanoarchaeota archaeon]
MKRKKKSKTIFKDAKTGKKFIDAYADLVTDDLMYILENYDESVFRNNARFFYLTEKEIDEILEIWRERDE